MGDIFEIVKLRKRRSHYLLVPIKILKVLGWREGDFLIINVVNGKLEVEKLEVKGS